MTAIPPNEPVTTANILRHMADGWQALQTWLATQSEGQLTQPTDAVGWTVKDHLVHIALWQGGLLAIVNSKSERAALGVDEATWAAGEESVNAVNQPRYQALSLAEVREMLQQRYDGLVAKITTMSNADLLRPFSDYQPDSQNSAPVWGWIVGNTFGHYHRHQPWMAAIAAQG